MAKTPRFHHRVNEPLHKQNSSLLAVPKVGKADSLKL